MTDSFGALAMRLYGIAARNLGWRPDDFWPATPCELIDALSPAPDDPGVGLERDELNKMMDHENA